MAFARAPIIVLLCLAAVAGACDSTTASRSPKAQVLVYSAIEADQIGPLLDAFRKEHPDIDVTLVRDSTGVITARLLAEAADPKADVVWGLAASSLLVADQKGLLSAYSPAGVEHIAPEFRDGASPPHWVGTSVWMTAFAANTSELRRRNLAVPTSFEDLAHPALKGLVTMPNPASSGTGFLTVVGILQAAGEEAGWTYLDRLHENVAQYTHSGSKPATMAAAGEYAVGVSMDARVIAEKARGAPLEVIFPAEKSGWDLEATALVKKAGNNPAAKTFVDWAVSPPAFTIYNRYFGVVAHDGFRAVPPGYPAKPLEQLAKNDLRWAAKNRDRILREWNRRYGGKSEPK